MYKALDGHQRIKALCSLREEGWDIPLLPVAFIEASDEADARKKLLAISSQYGEFDADELSEWMKGLDDGIADTLRIVDEEMDLFKDRSKEMEAVSLNDRFLIPPFSVLDSRQGYWQERKKKWKSLINDTGISRGDAKVRNNKSWKGYKTDFSKLPDVSILDPVLAEIAIIWFGIDKGLSFDCFAGDTVFGYVSSYLNQTFSGIEIRQEQADFNNKRIAEFANSKYYCDDGQNVLQHIEENSQDLLFSCPPYFDLEVYSNLENDASNQKDYDHFIEIIRSAFTNSIKCLKENRFAFIVVGDVRSKKDGSYYGFPDDIKKIFNDAGMVTYNELILVEMSGSAAMRASKHMGMRKVVKTHQNVLVFYKGDTKQIKNIFPKIEVNTDESTDV